MVTKRQLLLCIMAVIGVAAVTDANVTFLGTVDVHLRFVNSIIKIGGKAAKVAVGHILIDLLATTFLTLPIQLGQR